MLKSLIIGALAIILLLFILLNLWLWEKAKKTDNEERAKIFVRIIEYSVLSLFIMAIIQYFT